MQPLLRARLIADCQIAVDKQLCDQQDGASGGFCMRSALILLAGSALAAEGAANAAPELKFGAVPAWVVRQAIPAPSAKAKDQPASLLLHDQQTMIEPGKTSTFTEVALKIQKPEGLVAGNLSLAWNPATDTVTVHNLQIRRDSEVVDVLASGQKFTTMRREANLDQAMLDGVLTANIQPEGLQEGDVVVLTTTTDHLDPVLKGHVETSFAPWAGSQISLAHARLTWPSSLDVKIKKTGDLPSPRLTERDGRKSYELAMRDVEPMVAPRGAPLRFSIGRMGEASDFRSWADAATLMAPVYRAASVIPASGPLRQELEKIRRASNDPKVRVEQALQLVEQRVRYVALLMGEGGYIPATAEETWSRRFGDCKAKTALLLALLGELGIDAEPVLANIQAGDAIADRLPMLSVFNHVLVRARIAGKEYWLDGTRTGDSTLDNLETPNFGWGLPLIKDASLVRIAPRPLDRPNLLSKIEIDATGGVLAPARISLTTTYRGDAGVTLNSMYAQASAQQREEALRVVANKLFDGFAMSSSSLNFDKSERALTVSQSGSAKLNWKSGWFYVPGASIAFKPDFERPAGLFHDAPFLTSYPDFSRVSIVLHLPKGFASKQKLPAPVHETLAGVEYSRTARVSGDDLTIEVSERSIAPEVPYDKALAVAPRLKALEADDVYLNFNSSYRPSPEDMQALSSASPASASDLIQRGNVYMDNGRYDDAIADFNKAQSLDPSSNLAIVNRILAFVWKGDFKAAAKDIAAIEQVDPANAVLHRARGLMAERQGNFKAALVAYTKSLELEPNNGFTLGHRSVVQRALGNDDAALTDAASAMKMIPDWTELRILRAYTLLSQSKIDAAVGEAEQMIRNDKASEYALISAGTIYMKAGLPAKAQEAFDRALAIKRQPYIYLSRALARPSTDKAGRTNDFEAALKLKPGDVDTMAEAAKGYVALGNLRRALAIYDELVVSTPGFSEYAIYRATILYKLGRTADAEKIVASERKKAKTATDFNNSCWAKATAGVLLESGLADCRDALRLTPDKPTYLDSLGMVLLKLGKLDEALSAYDQAIARGSGASSIMGRALVYARKGDRAQAEADASTARRIVPLIEETYAEDYGLKL